MKELIEDKIYITLAQKYDELLLDYVLLSFDEEYWGIESHKKAVIEAISILNARERVGNSFLHPQFLVDEEKMCCMKYSTEDFFCDNNSSWETSENIRDVYKRQGIGNRDGETGIGNRCRERG